MPVYFVDLILSIRLDLLLARCARATMSATIVCTLTADFGFTLSHPGNPVLQADHS